MAKKSSSSLLKTPESPFKIYECYDLNTPTPRSSSRAQKKLFTCSSISSSSSFDKQGQNITWTDILAGKHPFSINSKGLITPPESSKLSLIEPVAPIKSRTSVKCISKVELKPKKLIFKDVEESESEIDNLPSSAVFKVKFINEDNANVVQDEDHEQAGKNMRYEIERSSRSKGNRRKIVNDDKENCLEFLHVKSKTNLVKATSVSSLTQRPNLNVKGSLKLFRV